jgi:hypothetical protein
MSHQKLFLVTTNDRKLIPSAFAHSDLSAADLSADGDGSFGAAVFASRTEVLFVRRPVEAGERLDALLDERLRTHRVLAVANTEAARAFVPHLTQPYRHKGWVFAMVGDTPPGDQPNHSEREADFVKQHGADESPAHRLMVRVMYRVTRATSGSNDPDARALVLAIREATYGLEGLNQYTIALTSETHGVVVSEGRHVYYKTIIPRGRGRHGQDPDIASIEHLRAVMVVDGVEHPRNDWRELEAGEALVIGEVPPARTLAI